jgi:hypothetical protein
MYSTPFPKLPKVKMWATKRPQKDMASMAQELMDQFNKDKYMINGQMDYSLCALLALPYRYRHDRRSRRGTLALALLLRASPGTMADGCAR